jgi:undecaprenyl diphosphate synthase
MSLIPRHIAVIMDGNGRWAETRGLSRTEGHREGGKRVSDLVDSCIRANVDVLSVYAFSSENWKRPPEEVNTLMRLFERYLKKETRSLHQKNIQLKVVGDRSPLKPSLQLLIEKSEILTHKNTGLKVRLAVNYGGRFEIVQAARRMAEEFQKGEIALADFSEENFQQRMDFSDVPDPDLFIRTSGEQRISNFMLWWLSYTELYFAPCFFPDFDEIEFQRALAWFSSRKRRFGAVS